MIVRFTMQELLATFCRQYRHQKKCQPQLCPFVFVFFFFGTLSAILIASSWMCAAYCLAPGHYLLLRPHLSTVPRNVPTTENK